MERVPDISNIGLAWPDDLKPTDIKQGSLRMELSAKQLFGKDKEGAKKKDGDFIARQRYA